MGQMLKPIFLKVPSPMNETEFNKILQERLDKTRETLKSKGSEYAHGDRLSNFKVGAVLMGKTPEGVLSGLIVKHIVALYDFVNELERGSVRSYDYWDEKIGDIIAYMILLDALIQERNAHE